MQVRTLSFRADAALVAETRLLAKQAGLRRFDYIREAVREQHERMMAARIATLSAKCPTWDTFLPAPQQPPQVFSPGI
ncbi:antitoxin of toxin-antitoxin stability system (plasmid) [Ralstonia solanacearum]|uniref:antitoxin of toxin-antitoxin stability system n=1 Tax=Ralstonia solanacearum TaxID=305 RepID=UPI001FFB1A27|nr:antitoxin of toxin-antitoxin stability system [Ralstonia solanacearum]